MNVAGLSTLGQTNADSAARVTELTARERASAAHLSGAALRHAAPAEQRAAVAAQFEAILVRQMLGKTVTSMLGSQSNAATNVYGDLLTDTFAQQLTAGSGLGLARMIEKQLTPHGEKPGASTPTAS